MSRDRNSSFVRRALGNRALVLVAVACIGALATGVVLSVTGFAKESAAVVNRKVITKDQLYRRMYDRVGAQVLQEMVDAILVEEEAARVGVTVTDQEVKDEIDRMIKEHYSSEEAFESALSYYGMTREDVEAQWRVEMAARKVLLGQVDFTEEEILAHFQANQEEFNQRERVRVMQIVSESEAEAQEILAELKAGADFGSVAKERSVDQATAQAGGDLGFVERGDLAAELEEAAFSLPVGEYSQPIQTAGGYYVLLVTERQQAAEVTLEQVRDRVIESLKEEKVQQMYPEWLSGLRSQATIQYNAPK